MVSVLARSEEHTSELQSRRQLVCRQLLVTKPAPLALAAGLKTSLPALMSAAETSWPTFTATPLSFSVPAPGRVLFFTAAGPSEVYSLSLHDALPISAKV